MINLQKNYALSEVLLIKTIFFFRKTLSMMLLSILLLFISPLYAYANEKLNVLFIGADGDQLLMTAVYNIYKIDTPNNENSFESKAIFFPSETLVSSKTMGQVFKDKDAGGLLPLLQKKLNVEISYFIKIERRALEEAKSFIDPIIIEGETVPLNDLFTMAIGTHDEEILGQLMERFTSPTVYFYHLPKLVLSEKKLVQTDFSPTITNLWLHFKIATGIDTTKIQKKVVRGYPLASMGEGLYIPHQTWASILNNN